MANRPITYRADPGTPARQGCAGSIARNPATFASAWFGAVAARCARAIAKEVRIRRDTRKLRLMSDEMLNDIGLTRSEISGAVRYGRD